MSNSVWPHRWQPTRLPHPRDSPGKNTGVGCHFLLQCMKVKSLSRVRLLVTPWTASYQAPLPMGFSRQEYWSGVPLPFNTSKIERSWWWSQPGIRQSHVYVLTLLLRSGCSIQWTYAYGHVPCRLAGFRLKFWALVEVGLRGTPPN